MGRVMVIAEVGVNHNGNLDTAKKLIVQAKNSGADAVKFQFFEASRLASSSAPLADYQKRNSGPSSDHQRQMLADLELTITQLAKLESEADRVGIEFFVSVFDSASIPRVREALRSNYLKIPSGEINNKALICEAALEGFDLLVSTGMSSIGEVCRAWEWIKVAGGNRSSICFLHCTSNYPTSSNDVHLNSLIQMKEHLGTPIGYSDHTQGFVAALGAVAMGATVIEKHITLNKDDLGPDHRASASPEEFTNYVRLLREMEESLGRSHKEPTTSELEMRKIVRKSPYASRKIQRGEVFDDSNLCLLRPASGLDASKYSDLVGRKAKTTYSGGETIKAEELLDS